MKITALEEYGLRCLVQLARHHSEDRPVAISEIAKAEGLSIQYVGKIMHELRRAGLINSLRGIHGGFVLAKAPQEISIADIFETMGGETPEHVCSKFSGNQTQCVHLGGCSIRSVWSFVMGQVSSVLKRISLADLIASESSCSSKLNEQHTQFETNKLPVYPAATEGAAK
ncbi:MAG: transcriptional regulator [Deltaproteobacteria bacterium CG11_big_fil_rev_8_21_14_0_20_47_16]|nr:MAG: transcriptional regulator [Deltaproteobacteria bacterium CG11_big_fil_rev_8_21_14_0_20_47_16]